MYCEAVMRQTLSFLVVTAISLLLFGACESSLDVGSLAVVRDAPFEDDKNPDPLYHVVKTSGVVEDQICTGLELARQSAVDADGKHYYGFVGSLTDPDTGEWPCAELKNSGDHLVVETMIPAKYRYITGNTGITLPTDPLDTTP